MYLNQVIVTYQATIFYCDIPIQVEDFEFYEYFHQLSYGQFLNVSIDYQDLCIQNLNLRQLFAGK